MANPLKNLDFNKIKAGMILPTVIGIIIVGLGFLFLFVVSLFSEYVPEVNQFIDMIAGTVSLLFSLLMYLFFMLLFLWTGYRTAHKYHATPVEAGLTSAFSYISIAVINLGLTFILAVLNAVGLVNYTAISTNVGGELNDIGLALVGIDAGAIIGIITGLCCSMILIVVSGLINFVIGAIGGAIGEKK